MAVAGKRKRETPGAAIALRHRRLWFEAPKSAHDNSLCDNQS